ncbi:MAG: hypothetical protein M1383_01610 [Patescibacteria group bacterium]|nr:hypothetical protein [Patescibacteria group bacterium]
MGQEDIKSLFEDKYAETLGLSYQSWQAKAPQTEEQAYARCIEIDRELNRTYDEWFEARGDRKDELQDYRDKLKAEYDLLEEIFHLEPNDRDW